MADAWDDDGSDDDAWDVDSDEGDAEIEARLGKLNTASSAPPKFDEEEDLAVKEKALSEARSTATLRTKGKALADKRAAEAERKEEEELARRAMELERKEEENMTAEELKLRERRRIEDADHALTNDLFGGVDDGPRGAGAGGEVVAVAKTAAGDTVVLVDMKDHLKHAKKVGQCIRAHGKVHLASAFLKEAIKECKDVLDDDAVSELITTLNVIKNEKVAAAKRKVKGQAQKSKSKRDKAGEAKAKKLQEELYGDSNKFDDYDAYGEAYEDDFF